MRLNRIKAACRLLALLLPAVAAAVPPGHVPGPGRAGPYPAVGDVLLGEPPSAGRPERKAEGFWRRGPQADTAAGQFALARQLEARGAWRQATRAFDALVRRWPNAPEAAAAQMKVAEMLEKRRKYADAFDEYLYLLHHYPGQFPTEEVLGRMFAIANHYRGRGSDSRAMEMFRQIARLAPGWSRAPAALLQVGLLQREARDLDLAAATFERIVGEYPGSEEARDAAAQAAECRYLLARRYPHDEAVALRAISALTVALRTFPDHPERRRLEAQLEEMRTRHAERHYRAAAFYDSPRHPRSAAVAAYREFLRRFPDAPQAAAARKRLDALREETAGEPPDNRPGDQGDQTP